MWDSSQPPVFGVRRFIAAVSWGLSLAPRRRTSHGHVAPRSPSDRRPACAAWLTLVTLLALVSLVGPVAAQERATVQVAGVELGFDGKYKVGDWAPVWVTLTAGDTPVRGRLELSVLDGDGVEAAYGDVSAPPLEVPAGGEATFLRYVKFGRVRSNLTVRLRDGETLLAERVFAPGQFPQPLPAGRELVVTLGGEAGVADAARLARRRDEEQMIAAMVNNVERLPDDWRGYDSVDTRVFVTGDSAFLEQLDSPRLAPLRQWLELGGRMLLSVGLHGVQMFGPDGLWPDLAPGRFVGVTPQQRTAGVETYINAAERLGSGDRRVIDLRMTALAEVRGRVEVAEIAGPVQRPVIVHYPFGLGQVTLITLDLDREPMASWRERSKLMRRLLEGAAGRAEQSLAESARGRVSHIGYEDLSGQLRAALDEFPGVTLVAFSWVAALLVLYVALIGPVDYLLLRRFGGRMERTWITFPAMVGLFCLLAWAGVRYFKSDRLLVNQIDLVDLDVQSGQVRGSTWMHIYSPRGETFDVSLTPQPAYNSAGGERGSILTWEGLPGGGLGGMNSTAGRLFNAPYRLTAERDEGALRIEPRDMPIQVRSTKALHGRWWDQAELPDAGRLTATSDGVLEGEVVNPLEVSLHGCLLVYNHWSYRLPQDMAPGARVQFTRRLPRCDL